MLVISFEPDGSAGGGGWLFGPPPALPVPQARLRKKTRPRATGFKFFSFWGLKSFLGKNNLKGLSTLPLLACLAADRRLH